MKKRSLELCNGDGLGSSGRVRVGQGGCALPLAAPPPRSRLTLQLRACDRGRPRAPRLPQPGGG